jgi:DNA-binding PadR family transcriptional regulator
MTISFAILGFLTERPLSGYDLKKLFITAESLHWSGNNNQIYKALTQLHREGLVSMEVQNPSEGPSRKLYTITPDGELALRTWVFSPPEVPEFKSQALVRLLGHNLLTSEELNTVFADYEVFLRAKLLGLGESERRAVSTPAANQFDRTIRLIFNRHTEFMFKAELDWLAEVRWTLTRGGV